MEINGSYIRLSQPVYYDYILMDLPRGEFDDVSGVYSPVSDERLKMNIEPLESTLDKVMSLKPKKYHFKQNKETDRKSYGLYCTGTGNGIP